LLVQLLLLAGCGDPLKQAQRLEEPRILGVRVSGADDEAALPPGQASNFEVLVAGPKGALEARVEYQLCEAAESNRGVPFCAEVPFATGTIALDGAPVPFAVPATVGADRRLALLGVACLESEPSLGDKPLDSTCSGSDEPLRVSFDARTASENVISRNPDLSALRVALDGNQVPLDDVNAAPSCAAGTLEVATEQAHVVELDLGGRARERLESDGAGRETLQLSHFSTRGIFQRQFSFVDPSAKEVKATVEWQAPRKPGPIKQYLVVRDERGGVSWVSVNLCVR
jgi:hypothetical protein